MSPQALVILIVYVIIFLISLGSSIYAKQFNILTFFGFLIYIGFIALITYDTNCLTIGNCGIWSWVRTIFYIIFPVLTMIMLLVSLFKKKDDGKINYS